MTPLPIRRSRRNLGAIAPVGILAALVLTACGTTEDSGDDDPMSTSTSSGPVTVTDSRGEEVVLEDGPADDVVALEWMEAENLVTLGVMPVGVADVEGYGTWVTAGELDETVTDVGTRAEPSIDSIVALEPDLIIMEAGRGITPEDLEEYAPVMVVQGSDASNNLEQMKTNFTMIAEAVGKTAEAEAILSDFDAALADGAAALEEAGVAGTAFAMADGWTDGGTVSIRMFGKGSLFSDIAEAMGLENAWTAEVDPEWGLGQTDVEGLTAIGDAEFFYHAAGEDNWPETLESNAIWNDLPFVQNEQVNALEPGTWTFGGPASSQQFIDQVVAALAS